MHNTAQNIDKILTQIKQLEQLYRTPESKVQLMAVSKKKPAALVEQAYQSGQRIFGESYVQEALLKIQVLQHLPDIQWHFIGPIQSNKTKDIAANFDWVHSVDRLKIIARLNSQRPDDKPPINVCLQVNIDAEVSKSGFSPDEVLEAAKAVLIAPNLTLRGLMAIPKPCVEISGQRRAFQRVNHLYQQLKGLSVKVDILSMGMSGDLEAAIAEGSTMVRIGTSIFGVREQ